MKVRTFLLALLTGCSVDTGRVEQPESLADSLYYEAAQIESLHGQMEELRSTIQPSLLAVFDSTIMHIRRSVSALEETADELVETEQELAGQAERSAEIVEERLMMSSPPPGMGRMEYVMEYIPAVRRETYLAARELQDALLDPLIDSARALVLQARQARTAALDLIPKAQE